MRVGREVLLKPPFHCVVHVLNRRDDLSLEERDGLTLDKSHHIILVEKPLCVPDHPVIIPMILHGLHADPGDEEEKEGRQEETEY